MINGSLTSHDIVSIDVELAATCAQQQYSRHRARVCAPARFFYHYYLHKLGKIYFAAFVVAICARFFDDLCARARQVLCMYARA